MQEELTEFVIQRVLYGIGGGHTRKHRIATDVLTRLMHGDKLGQIVDGRLGCAIADLRNIRHGAANRGDVDDAAGFTLRHIFQRGLRRNEHGLEVDIHRVDELLRVGVLDVEILGGIGRAEIIDEHVDAALIGHDLFHSGHIGLILRGIVVHELRRSRQIGGGKLVDLRLRTFRVARRHIHGGTLFGETLHNRIADASGRSGDHGHLACQTPCIASHNNSPSHCCAAVASHHHHRIAVIALMRTAPRKSPCREPGRPSRLYDGLVGISTTTGGKP